MSATMFLRIYTLVILLTVAAAPAHAGIIHFCNITRHDITFYVTVVENPDSPGTGAQSFPYVTAPGTAVEHPGQGFCVLKDIYMSGTAVLMDGHVGTQGLCTSAGGSKRINIVNARQGQVPAGAFHARQTGLIANFHAQATPLGC